MMTTISLRQGRPLTTGLLLFLLLPLFPEGSALGADPTLESRLLPLIEAHEGKVAVAVKNLKTGESFVSHADDPMPTASLIKFPVMVETYRQADA
jgi:beta-lactamase class A